MDPHGEVKQVVDEPLEAVDATDDVEGHSFGPAVLGTIMTMQHGRQRQPERHGTDDALPPLTKPFPRMREDRK
jgi:hypothetical protein